MPLTDLFTKKCE